METLAGLRAKILAGECIEMSADTESFKSADTDTDTETDNFLSLVIWDLSLWINLITLTKW